MLQGTPNPLAPYTLVATAARLSHAVGLHRWLDDFGLTVEQADERRHGHGAETHDRECGT